MDNYASDDPGPSFLVGHHESNRAVPVDADMIFKVHEANVRGPISLYVLVHSILTKLFSMIC